MSDFLPALMATFLAEWGDRTQVLAMMLALRFRGSPKVLWGLGGAVVANTALGVVAGHQIGLLLSHRSARLMTGIALVLGGMGALLPQAPPRLPAMRGDAVLWASFIAFFTAGLGDKAQFLAMALAAQGPSPLLVGAGATLGIFLANAPAVLLGDRITAAVPLRAIRKGVGLLLIVPGVIVAIVALRLA